MAFPSVATILDDFTGTESPITTNWTNITGTISKNGTVYAEAASSGAYYDLATFGPIGSGTGVDFFATVSTKGNANEWFSIICLTYLAEYDGYSIELNMGASATNETLTLYRLDNGVATAISTPASVDVTDGDKFGIRCLGSSQKAYYKAGAGAWTEQGTGATDATYSGSVTPVIGFDYTVFRGDDFGGGTYAESSSSSSRRSSSSSSRSSSSRSSSSSSRRSSSSSSRSSSSRSSSRSSSSSGAPTGDVCWGHVTGVAEDHARVFTGNWAGTGLVSGSWDTEIITVYLGQYMESETWELGAGTAVIELDKYRTGSGGAPTVYYKTGATSAACNADSWHAFGSSFTSLGWVKVKLEY